MLSDGRVAVDACELSDARVAIDVLLHIFAGVCSVNGRMMSLFSRVQEQAVERYAMKEVFSMESHVRIEAIQNLGKQSSSAEHLYSSLHKATKCTCTCATVVNALLTKLLQESSTALLSWTLS